MVSQSYLAAAMGKLEVISNIQQIESVSKARYYKLSIFLSIPPLLVSLLMLQLQENIMKT